MKLADKISHWEQAKIISAYQGQAILEYEKRIGHPKFFLSVVLLSIFSIGIGIIAIISANWDNIPKLAKLSADIILLLGLALGVIWANQTKRNTLCEGLLWAYAIMLLGSIGLIGQIYQLQGDIYSALSFWGVLSFPLVLISRRGWLSIIWALLSFSSWYYVLEHNAEWFRELIKFWHNNYVFGGWLLVFVAILCVSQILIKHQAQLAQTLKVWCYVYFTFVVVDSDFGWFLTTSVSHVSGLTYGLTGAALAVLIGFYLWNKKHQTDTLMSQFLFVLWGYSAIIELVPHYLLKSGVLGFILTVSIIGQGIYYCFCRQLFRTANILIILLALRIFIAFLQVFGSLITTGIGLIVGGILLLTLGYLTKKFMVYNCPRGENA